MEDQERFVHLYLTIFAPEVVAIGLNSLAYIVIKRSEKLQNSALLRRDMTLNIAGTFFLSLVTQLIMNYFRDFRNLHAVACTGMAYITQVSIGVTRCAITVAAFNRYASVGTVKCGFDDLARKDLTLFVWIASAIFETPNLLNFGIEDGLCGFLHPHLVNAYIVAFTVMAFIPLILYGIILQLTITAMPDHVALSEDRVVLKRSTKIMRGVLVGGLFVFLPVMLWILIVDSIPIAFNYCFGISHVLLIVIGVAEVICFAFMDPVFQLEYREFGPASETDDPYP